jgi:hypothetical protein
MLWYDAFSLKNSILFRIKKYKNLQKNIKNIPINPKTTQKLNYYFSYTIPSSWKLTIFYNKTLNVRYIKIYSYSYFIVIPIYLNQYTLKFDNNTNQLFLHFFYKNIYTRLYFNTLNYFYNILIKPLFFKIKFKGKGYYIYKNFRNTITPQFGYSHRLYLYSYYLYINFLNKTSLIIFGLSLKNLNYVSAQIYNWRPINIFTGRGVRFVKQVIYKKSGKISTYR